VTAATWVIAVSALGTALMNGWLQWRHRRWDDERFARVHRQLNGGREDGERLG
jgi:hypothetical protein